MRQRQTAAGFTLLELVVVISIIGLLGVVAVDRLLLVQEQAEKVMMEETASILRSALRLQMADLIARQRMSQIAGLVNRNPMDWLAEKPVNYVGEFDSAPGPHVPPGHWYFDRRDRTLVYLVDRGRHFVPDAQGRKQVKYRVVIVSQGAQEQRDQVVIPETVGITLSLVTPYQWF